MRYDKTPAWGATCGMKPSAMPAGSLSRISSSDAPVRQVATAALERAVREVYGCGTVFLEVVPVIARVAGQASLFAVTVFRLVGHPTAARCFARHRGIEAIGPPFHLESNIGALLQGARQAAFSDKAPRTHRVGDYVDLHGRKLSAEPAP